MDGLAEAGQAQQQQQQQQPQQPQGQAANYESMMAVVSGDSDGGNLSDEDEILLSVKSRPDNDGSDMENKNYGYQSSESEDETKDPAQDHLYDEDLDAEDEAYVYMNLRGGKHGHDKTKTKAKSTKQGNTAMDTTTTAAAPTSASTTAQTPTTCTPPPTVTKARNSDAALSCPCCFNVICMDCQRHERYHNQFRAMFVMGIEVDWEHRLVHDGNNGKKQGLVRYEPPVPINTTPAITTTTKSPQIVVPDQQQNHPNGSTDAVIYYAVSCANCHTMVAALDMDDEVYHFYDCLASS